MRSQVKRGVETGTDWNLRRLTADVLTRAFDGHRCRRFHPESRVRGTHFNQQRSLAMTLGTILVIVLILILIGAIPNWGYSRGWGYGPSGIVGVVLVVVLILLLMGRI